VINEMARVSNEDRKISDVEGFKKALFKRESLMSTGIGYGVAIPHVKLELIKEFFITFFIHKKGVDWESLDNKPVHIIFLIAGPETGQEKYLRILAKITMVIKDSARRKKLIDCNTKYEIYEILNKF
ncbi:MAG TPA: PTS sugar transporter subunit IIA, partial [Spirochaetes bacterium]|nr:PTS sugar transporter subunit IIA [Spirochaetota bacterium]